METIKVKDGAEIPRVTIDVTMLSLRSLQNEQPIAFYELAMSCRDRQHVLFGGTPAVLIRRHLIESVDNNGCARVHDVVRSVVNSAVSGDGFDMNLGEPIVATT